jgi:hypothetical protein
MPIVPFLRPAAREWIALTVIMLTHVAVPGLVPEGVILQPVDVRRLRGP